MAMRSCSLVTVAVLLVNAECRSGAAEEGSHQPRRGHRQIDRHALVTRHNVVLTNADPCGTLQVGNGEFAFAVDITGLQTFPAEYAEGIQLGTQAQWGWGSAGNPEHFSVEDVLSPYESHGRQVVYADGAGKLHNAGNPERARQWRSACCRCHDGRRMGRGSGEAQSWFSRQRPVDRGLGRT